MKNILIPYDFSESAINALNYTKKLFEGFKMNIYLLDVYISKPSNFLTEEENKEWFDQMDDGIESELKYLLEVLDNEESSFNYEGVVKAESLINAMKSTIEDKDIDFIITGTKGVKSLTETFIGSNTLRMINKINNCSILAVPEKYKYKPLHQIVFSTNFKRPFTTKELKTLIQLSILKDCDIEVVNLSDEALLTHKQQVHRVQLRKIFQDLGVTYKKLDWVDSETSTLESHIENTESQMLVLVNHKYNFFSRLTEENVIKKSAFQSKIPLLVLPEKNISQDK